MAQLPEHLLLSRAMFYECIAGFSGNHDKGMARFKGGSLNVEVNGGEFLALKLSCRALQVLPCPLSERSDLPFTALDKVCLDRVW